MKRERITVYLLVAAFAVLVVLIIVGFAQANSHTFSYSYTPDTNNLRLEFNATTFETDQYYEWNFGDSENVVFTTGNQTSHRYKDVGFYTVRLNITTDGVVQTFEERVKVGYFSWFLWEVEEVENGWILSVESIEDVERPTFSWGDGSDSTAGTVASHFYDEAGEYKITLSAYRDGREFTNTKDILVGIEKNENLFLELTPLIAIAGIFGILVALVAKQFPIFMVGIGLATLAGLMFFAPEMFVFLE